MKKKILIVAAVIASSHLSAQEDSTSKLLDEVVITSNKYPRKQSETGKVITIINRQQLERSAGKNIGEVLNTVAGTNILGANSNPGTNLTASIRGASAGNTLILVNGIPITDPSVNNNYFDLNFFSPDQVERIEILKGGQSTLYGSDAVLGVINIILKKPVDGKTKINAALTGGSYNTFKQNIGLNGKQKSAAYSVNYTHISSAGFSTAYDESGTGNFDKDGYGQHIANTRIDLGLSKKVKIYISGIYSYYNADLDASAFTDEKDFTVKNKNAQAGTGLSWQHRVGSLHFNYHFNYTDRSYLDDSTYKSSPYTDYSKSDYIGRTHFAELYNNWKWSNWDLLTGTDYRLNNTDQYYFSTGLFGPYTSYLSAKMNQVSTYASVIYHNDNGITTEAGGRWNNHSEYGSNFSFTLNPSILIDKKVKLFANLYSAYKTPTLYQLFDEFAGNAALEPEKGLIGELGTELFTRHSLHARIVGFYRNTKDAIVYTYNPSTYESKYLNVSKQKNYGLETEISYAVGKLTITANYTYTDGETTSAYDGTGSPIGKDTTYFNLYRIPKHAINIGAGIQVTKSLFVNAHLRSVSKREEFIFGAAPETLKAYTTIDLYGEYKFSKKMKAFIDLKNLTNKKYFDLLGYNSKRFNFNTGVNLNL